MPDRKINGVYVATVLQNGDVVLQNRSYEVVELVKRGQVGIKPLLIMGACICQIDSAPLSLPEQRVAAGGHSEGVGYWFCKNKSPGGGGHATATIHDEEGVRQVVMTSPGCEEFG